MDGWIEKDGRKEGGRMEGWKDGREWMEGWKDGRREGYRLGFLEARERGW